MLRIDNILVASDFTPAATRALRVAQNLASHTDAALCVVHLLGEEAAAAVETAAAERVIWKQVKDLVPASQRVEVLVLPGNTDDLLALARERDVDLVVLGARGRRGGLKGMGHVAARVLRQSERPVLTVGGSRPTGAEAFKTILVPVDFSIYSRVALRHARELAAFYGARVELLHVLDPHVHSTFYHAGILSIYDLIPDANERLEEQLRRFYRETEGPMDVAGLVVRSGKAAEEIVAYAEETAVDLIVQSTHGLTGLRHLLLGSVAEAVARDAPAPVLTVKAFGHSLVELTRGDVVDELDLLEG